MPEDLRGQTEPIAALVAVSTVALALSFYGVVLLDVLDQDTERQVAEPTVGSVWSEIRDGGIYDNTSDVNLETKLERAINDSRSPFPNGHNVRIRVTHLTEDGETTVDAASFAWTTGNPAWDADVIEQAPPARASAATRPVPIRFERGNIETGTLRVEVWQP